MSSAHYSLLNPLSFKNWFCQDHGQLSKKEISLQLLQLAAWQAVQLHVVLCHQSTRLWRISWDTFLLLTVRTSRPCGEQVHEVGSSFLQGYCNWGCSSPTKSPSRVFLVQECLQVWNLPPKRNFPWWQSWKGCCGVVRKDIHTPLLGSINTHVCLETCQTHYEKHMKQILQQRWWGWLPWTYLAARAAPCLVPS